MEVNWLSVWKLICTPSTAKTQIAASQRIVLNMHMHTLTRVHTHTHTQLQREGLYTNCAVLEISSTQNWTAGSTEKLEVIHLWSEISMLLRSEYYLITLVIFRKMSFMLPIFKFQSQNVPAHWIFLDVAVEVNVKGHPLECLILSHLTEFLACHI